MAEEIIGAQVNAVLKTVIEQTLDGDAQLSILCFALVVACKSCGISEEIAHEKLRAHFAQPLNLIPINPATGKPDNG